VRVPSWLEHPLSLLAYVYLGLGVLFAATGSAYVICQYDPFVPIFRLGGPFYMIVLAGLFIVLAMFVGRPYCRFLCPYAVLLRLFSRVSKNHMNIYPDSCINCRLCEESCPFEAINPSTGDKTEKVPRRTGKKTLVGAVVALPLLCVALGFLGSRLAGPLSRVHRTVALADMVATDQLARADGGKPVQVPDEVTAFYDGYGRDAETIHQLGKRAQEVYGEFVIGGWFLGIFIGLAAGIKLIGLLLRPRRDEYQADRGACFSCARCFDYCPGAAAGIPGAERDEDEGGIHAASSSA
jgi:NosR/NirI family transcriptional regulator, nitrous oxide reductase regulator